MKKFITIIGAGIAGLATALRLSDTRANIKVFEKNSFAGGKMAQFHMDKFRFDMGPSLVTLPELLEDLFNSCGERLNNYLEFVKLDNICRYFYPDGTKLDALSNATEFAIELSEKTGVEAKKVTEFLNENRLLYDLTASTFLFSPFQKLRTFTSPDARKIGRNLHKMHFLQNMHNRNNRKFRNKNVTQLFDRYATYNGSNPYKAPATLNMIAHLEHNLGAFFPKRGMYSIVESMLEAIKKKHIDIHFNSAVDEIVTGNGEVKGVIVNGKFIESDFVIDTTDHEYSKRNLNKNDTTRRLMNTQLSSSALIYYWGIKGEYPKLDLHNILFSDDYKTEFTYLFNKFDIFGDPTVYIYISSKINRKDAPPGCENWFVMVNAPNDRGQNWPEIIKRTRKEIMQKIKDILDIDVSNQLESEYVISPANIESRTNSYRGAIYGASSNSILSAFVRPSNFSRKFKRLYYAGGSVHPGGGIPLCLASANIVADLIKEEIH